MVLKDVVTLLIKKQAKKALQSVPQPDKTRITEKIVLLGKNPDDVSLGKEVKRWSLFPIACRVMANYFR